MISGDLSIVASDGSLLRAPNDLRLAWAWAEHEVNLNPAEFPGGWAALGRWARNTIVSDALAELRRAYAQGN